MKVVNRMPAGDTQHMHDDELCETTAAASCCKKDEACVGIQEMKVVGRTPAEYIHTYSSWQASITA
jgi:hypothetical protein